MADKLDTAMGNSPSLSLTMGTGEAEPVDTQADALDSTIYNEEEAQELENVEKIDDPQSGDEPVEGADEDQEKEGEQENEEEVPAAPEEFNEENVAEWDALYVDQESGELNIQALSQRFWKDVEGGAEDMSDAQYAYLASKGFPKDLVKDYVAKSLNEKSSGGAKETTNQNAVFAHVGDTDSLGAALQWGREGGYDEAAQKRFNKVMNSGTPEEAKDAADILMARYARANPKPKENPKPAVPKRDATKGQGRPNPTQVKPFGSIKEFSDARKAAGGNQAKMLEISNRLAVSDL